MSRSTSALTSLLVLRNQPSEGPPATSVVRIRFSKMFQSNVFNAKNAHSNEVLYCVVVSTSAQIPMSPRGASGEPYRGNRLRVRELR